MFSFIRTAALAATVATGAAGMASTPASADTIQAGFRSGGVEIGIGMGPNWGQGPQWGYRKFPRVCTDHRAVEKARALGMRHAHVVRSDYEFVTVRGRLNGDRARLTFSRAPNCPIIYW